MQKDRKDTDAFGKHLSVLLREDAGLKQTNAVW